MNAARNPGRRPVSVMVGMGLVVGVLTPSILLAGQAPPAVTFTKDIAPILQRTCQNCHRPAGGIGPMPLTTYEEVRPWAQAVKRRTLAREMPPWYIEKNVGIQKFKDDISLSDQEIATIARWVDSGAPRGNPADLPPPREFTPANTWSIGEPDLVLRSPVQIVKAVGGDVHKPYLGPAPTGLTQDRWIRAFQAREHRLDESKWSVGRAGGGNDLFVLHHQGISTSPPEFFEENQRPVEGFSYTYEVGQNAQFYPEGVGVKLGPGSTIHFNQTHQHSVGKEVKLQVEIGFKFYPDGYTPKYEKKPGRMGRTPANLGWGAELDIPGNTDDIRHEQFWVLDRPARMMTFEPHLHASGKRMCAEAIYPDGRIETMSCAGYNHSWVRAYVYDDDHAPLLPKGTILHFVGWYDNTSKNPRVVDPRNWRGLGHRSIDDMFIDISQYHYYTDEEFSAEVAAREAKRRGTTTTQNQP